MTRVFIHPLAGVLSAYGMGLADQVAMREQRGRGEARATRCLLEDIAETLAIEARDELVRAGRAGGQACASCGARI